MAISTALAPASRRRQCWTRALMPDSRSERRHGLDQAGGHGPDEDEYRHNSAQNQACEQPELDHHRPSRAGGADTKAHEKR